MVNRYEAASRWAWVRQYSAIHLCDTAVQPAVQLVAQLVSARFKCSPTHPLHKPLHPHTYMYLEGRRFESDDMRAFLPFTYVCNLSSSFCHQCVCTCICACMKNNWGRERKRDTWGRGIDEEEGRKRDLPLDGKACFLIWQFPLKYYPLPNPPNPGTQIPRYEFKLNPNLNSNLKREIPKNISFSISWILGV